MRSLLPHSVTKMQIVATAAVTLGLALGLASTPVQAANDGAKVGRETGLPLPRFVSLKSKSVNLRVGPGRKYSISWQYKKRGLPVEIIQEFDQWRRIRDADGATGWVLHSLLSSKRMAVIAPWEKPKIDFGVAVKQPFLDGKNSASSQSAVIAKLQAGLLVKVEYCSDNWCALEARDTEFWMKQEQLWGVYPNETVDG